MPIQQLLFWVLATMSIACALGVILSRNPISSVLFLILTFFSISGHYILLNAQFLFIVNIIVYTGAIMVLFLFVIMLMNLNADVEPQKNKLVQFAAVISGGVLFLVLLAALRSATLDPLNEYPSSIGLIATLGKKLFTEYVLPFEISSVLFLSAMVGAIVIGKKDEGHEGEDNTSGMAQYVRNPNQN